MSKPILELKNVQTLVNKGTANETMILKGINLQINAGDFITIVGTNGAGKSTLFNVIGGNLRADNGQILHNGRDITRTSEEDRTSFLARVFQDPKLGTALMKAFVFALTKQDQLPETILCYNTGAYLTCEGSELLEDLKLLESEGVTIFTCGTCLDFYGIRDKLAVGSVTNMYEIVERMETAGHIVKP